MLCMILIFFFFQAEDGIRDLERSRGLGDVYKRQLCSFRGQDSGRNKARVSRHNAIDDRHSKARPFLLCLLYTSDAADERSSVDLGGRRIIKKTKKKKKM